MLDPEVDKLERSGRVTVVKIEVDKHPDLARHYGVSSIPRLLLLEHGTVLGDRVGYADSKQSNPGSITPPTDRGSSDDRPRRWSVSIRPSCAIVGPYARQVAAHAVM